MLDTADKMRRNKPATDLKEMIISKVDFGGIQRIIIEDAIAGRTKNMSFPADSRAVLLSLDRSRRYPEDLTNQKGRK